MKIRSVGAELYHADGRTNGRTDEDTDMTKLTVVSRNFGNPPPPQICLLTCVDLRMAEPIFIKLGIRNIY